MHFGSHMVALGSDNQQQLFPAEGHAWLCGVYPQSKSIQLIKAVTTEHMTPPSFVN